METSSILNLVVGGFFVLFGLVMIVFHEHIREFQESIHESFPDPITRYWPRGTVLTIFIVVFGALSLLGGITVVLVNLV